MNRKLGVSETAATGLRDADHRRWRLLFARDFPTHDSIWAMACGADGHLYFSLCEEFTGGGVAQLMRIHTGALRLEHVADMARVCGEPADSGMATQGKIHFALCPASDGSLYGATHCTTFPMHHRIWNPAAMWGDPYHRFPGGHLFRFDPATGRTVDFGVMTPHEGIPFLLLDEARERLYGITYPRAHLFRTDLDGRRRVDYGRLSGWYPIAACFDAARNLILSDVNARIVKLDTARDRLIFTHAGPQLPDWNRSRRHAWIANLVLAEDGFIYGAHYASDRLFRFDPARDPLTFEDLGPGVPGVPCTFLRSLTPDGRGGLYYMGACDGGTRRVGARRDLRTGRVEVLGRLVIRGVPLSSWIGAMDPQGRWYVKGNGRPMCMAVYDPRRPGSSA